MVPGSEEPDQRKAVRFSKEGKKEFGPLAAGQGTQGAHLSRRLPPNPYMNMTPRLPDDNRRLGNIDCKPMPKYCNAEPRQRGSTIVSAGHSSLIMVASYFKKRLMTQMLFWRQVLNPRHTLACLRFKICLHRDFKPKSLFGRAFRKEVKHDDILQEKNTHRSGQDLRLSR